MKDTYFPLSPICSAPTFWLELDIIAASCERHPLFTVCTVFIAWLKIRTVIVFWTCFMIFPAWLLDCIVNVLVVVCVRTHALSSSGVASFTVHRYQNPLEMIPWYERRGGGGFGPAYCSFNCSRHQLLNKKSFGMHGAQVHFALLGNCTRKWVIFMLNGDFGHILQRINEADPFYFLQLFKPHCWIGYYTACFIDV